MISFLNRSVRTKDLLNTALYDETMFYKAFTKDVKRAKVEVIIESPYLTCKRAVELRPIFKKLSKKGIKVRINTRYPNHHDEYLRIQAWTAIKILKPAGIKIKLYNDLRHRKIAVIDRCILWEGSLNIMSQNNSREVMRRTESIILCRQMLNFTGLNRWFW